MSVQRHLPEFAHSLFLKLETDGIPLLLADGQDQDQPMKIIELNLPDLSEHPSPPQVDLGVFEAWVRGDAATRTRAAMTDAEILADFMRNEGRQTEEWPDFGAA